MCVASDPSGPSAARRCGQGFEILGTGPGDCIEMAGLCVLGLAPCVRVGSIGAVESEIPRPSSRETAPPPHFG